MSEYNSSEELQRHSADVFARQQTKKAEASVTETDKVKKVLDRYIAKHSSTKHIRTLAKESKRTADQQLDLSADLVEILEKIKSELR